MKKIIALILVLTLTLFAFASCGKKNKDETPDNNQGTTETPDNNQGNTGNQGTTNNPQTGDSMNMVLWFALLGIAAIGMASVLVINKKKTF